MSKEAHESLKLEAARLVMDDGCIDGVGNRDYDDDDGGNTAALMPKPQTPNPKP